MDVGVAAGQRHEHRGAAPRLRPPAWGPAPTAAALAAVSRAMGPLLADGTAEQRISGAAWPLAAAAGTTALGALASIASASAARRLNPGMSTIADLAMVDAHMDVELSAYDAPDFTERSEAAETGSARSAMLLQDALGFTGGLIDMVAVASVISLVPPSCCPCSCCRSSPGAWAPSSPPGSTTASTTKPSPPAASAT